MNFLRVGRWRLVPELNLLTSGTERRRLEPRVMQLLIVLHEARGRIVSRQELIASVWPDGAPSDEGLTQAVSALRRALGDSARSPRFVETIPKRGYRLKDQEEVPAIRRRPALLSAGLFLVLTSLIVASVGHRTGVPGLALDSPRLRPVTTMRGRETEPSVSRAGSLAFTAAGADGFFKIWLSSLNGSDPHRLTRNDGLELSPAWSPEGSRVAFALASSDRCRIAVADLQGVPRFIGTCRQDSYPQVTWTPDGRSLVVSDGDERGVAFLSAIDVATGSRRRLTTPPDGVGDRSPSVSPDGTTLAFARMGNMGRGYVWTLSFATGMARALTKDSAPLRGLTWHSERSIVFSSARRGDFALWRIDAGGGTPISLHLDASPAVRPVSLASGALLFEWQHFDSDVFELALAGVSQPRRTRFASTRWEDEPRVSPDGRSIAFTSERDGSRQIWIATEDSPARQLTRIPEGNVRGPRWSPTGSAIAFATGSSTSSDIWIIGVDGRGLRRVSGTGPFAVAPAWALDGTSIYYVSNRRGAWAIYRQSLQDDASPVSVAAVPAAAIFDSPRGLVYSRADRTGLWLRHRDGREELLAASFRRGCWANWELREDEVWFVYLDGGQAHLARLDLATGTRRRLSALATGEDVGGLTVAPDGSAVFFALADRSESDLMMASFVD